MNNPAFKIVGIIFLLLLFVALILTPMHKPKKVVPAAKKAAQIVRGRIAIVVDDCGYHLNNLPIIKQIKQPLTCAILPELNDSTVVMQELNKSGFEIILHLPMEPHFPIESKEKFNLEKNTIMVNMSAAQIHGIFERDLTSVSLAKGINNHMGSKVTEDKRATGLVLAEIKARQLYFLDSFVTNKSCGPDLAKQLKVRFAKRDVFLDNQDDPVYIKGQLLKVKNLARRQGLAIAIGHDRRNTLLVLKEMLPQMEKEGYRFVFLSQVVR
jgi:uncharacterized protein